jgi:hypothetical protein
MSAKCEYWTSEFGACPVTRKRAAETLEVYRPELPILLLLDPLMDVALDPVVDVPLEPTTGVLGATGALLGAVLPVPPTNGVTLGIAVKPGGRMLGRRATSLPGNRPLLARHCLMNLLLCLPV